jgi:PhnB protein
MAAQISPMLAVSDPDGAIDFYERAFGAEVRWRIGEPTQVAGLTIAGAELFLSRENPPKTRGPDAAGHTTVRIELFVADPEGVQRQAVAAGGVEANPVQMHSHTIVGEVSPMRMLQGGVIDPFGHHWLIGKFLE